MPQEKGAEATSQPAKKKRGLTVKQQALAKAITITPNVSEAGRMAGYGTAQSTHRALKTVQEKLQEALEKFGITADAIAENCLKPGMTAIRTEFFANDGIVMETREVIDHTVRLKTAELWAKLTGAVSRRDGESEEAAGPAVVINLGFMGPEAARTVFEGKPASIANR
jgi:hypothetical protein